MNEQDGLIHPRDPNTDFRNETYCDQKMSDEINNHQKHLSVGDYCHHRGEQHELRITYDGKCRRCTRCGLYFELESQP